MEGRVTSRSKAAPGLIRAWKYVVLGVNGDSVPVYLLDTELPENYRMGPPADRHLYGGDEHTACAQEVILGMGGMKILQKLGHADIQGYHMNEGHSALLALGLLERRLDQSFAGRVKKIDIDGIRRMCIFTTHTPVPAGHDQFPARHGGADTGRSKQPVAGRDATPGMATSST